MPNAKPSLAETARWDRHVVADSLQAALATLVGIGGSVALVFLAVGLWLSGMGFSTPGGSSGRPLTPWFVALGIAVVLLPPFAGGGVWGWGIARVFERAPVPALKTGALAFGGMVLLTAAPTDLTQLWLDDLPSWFPFDVHGYFTLVFMVEVGVVSLVATWRLARRLGAGSESLPIAAWTGGAASVGFLLGSMLALVIGFRIHPWVRFSMVWAFLTALPVSTLAAGAVLGARLPKTLDGGRRT